MSSMMIRRPRRGARLVLAQAAVLVATLAVPASADEGGAGFWMPGFSASLAASPAPRGWSVPVVYYHTSADASVTRSFQVGGNTSFGLDAVADLAILAPTYTFGDGTTTKHPQVSLIVLAIAGGSDVSAALTLTEPGGSTLSADKASHVSGIGDLFTAVQARWQDGNHNYMGYVLAGFPVGDYEKGRLANLSINHAGIDFGGAYTYLNEDNGRELSATAGLTYNFENSDTDYQNGIDSHVDIGLSQFLSKQVHVGAVGYAYYQLTGDSGSGARLGDFKSRVFAAGPQAGYLFAGDRSVYANVRAYFEFEAKHRLEGWNLWATLAVPLTPSAQ